MNRWTVAAASIVMMAGLGSFNAWSVFRRPLSELYGANVTDVNTAFFVSSLVFGLVASGSALLVGRVGPRFVGVTGAVVYGLGVFLSSFAGENLTLLYLRPFCPDHEEVLSTTRLLLGDTRKPLRSMGLSRSIYLPPSARSSARIRAASRGIGLGASRTTSTPRPTTSSAHPLPLPSYPASSQRCFSRLH